MGHWPWDRNGHLLIAIGCLKLSSCWLIKTFFDDKQQLSQSVSGCLVKVVTWLHRLHVLCTFQRFGGGFGDETTHSNEKEGEKQWHIYIYINRHLVPSRLYINITTVLLSKNRSWYINYKRGQQCNETDAAAVTDAWFKKFACQGSGEQLVGRRPSQLSH